MQNKIYIHVQRTFVTVNRKFENVDCLSNNRKLETHERLAGAGWSWDA